VNVVTYPGEQTWNKMPKFRVRCFKNGVWDGNDLVEIMADSPEHAASQACGEPLRGGVGNVHDLRAHVWQADSDPTHLTVPEFLFYARE